jgi:outer membrane protein TolC
MRLILATYCLGIAMGCMALSNFAAAQSSADEAMTVEASTTSAQTPTQRYDLEEVIERVLEISPEVMVSQYSLEEAQAQYQKARNASIAPEFTLNLSGGVVPDSPANIGPEFGFPDTGLFETDDWGPFVRLTIELVQPIYTFGKIRSLQRAATQKVEAGEQEVRKTRNELILQTKRAYYGLANLYSFLDFIEDLGDRSAKAHGTIKQMIEDGSSEVTDIDLMRLEIFQAETERRRIELTHNIRFLKMTLKILMGLERDIDFDIKDQKIRMSDAKIEDVEHYLRIAQQHRPEILQLDNLVEGQEALMDGQRAEFLPDIGIAGQYRHNVAPGRQQINNPYLVNNDNIQAAGGALFLRQKLNFHLTTPDYRKAKAAYEGAKAKRQEALRKMEIQIRKSHNDAVAKQDAFAQSKLAFKKVRSYVLSTTLNFGVGVTPPKDLVEAFVAYTQVRSEYLKTMYDFQIAHATLAYAIGKY